MSPNPIPQIPIRKGPSSAGPKPISPPRYPR